MTIVKYIQTREFPLFTKWLETLFFKKVLLMKSPTSWFSAHQLQIKNKKPGANGTSGLSQMWLWLIDGDTKGHMTYSALDTWVGMTKLRCAKE